MSGTRAPFPPALAQALAARFGERFSIGEAIRAHHGRDESAHPPAPPDAVVYPLIPYGAGSSLEGHLLAVHGGVSIDLSQMNRVLGIDAEDLTATVQAGVLRIQHFDAGDLESQDGELLGIQEVR